MLRCFLLLVCALPLLAQSNAGELRLKVLDTTGVGVQSAVTVVDEADAYKQSFVTDDKGILAITRLPFGVYQVTVEHKGFAPATASIDVRSAIPQEHEIRLSVNPVNTTVDVKGQSTLLDPYRAGSVNQIGTAQIEERPSSLPGRSLLDLVNSQPGWLYEGNAVLHPRGTEYATQFVLDGMPLSDNRSPGHGTEVEAADIDSMSVYTAGIPAEYGRKMGGVIEIDTARDTRSGVHGQVDLSGGSFDTAGGDTMLQYLSGKNSFAVSVDGATTGWYLNPPVPENYTNNGTTGDFAGSYGRDFTSNDRLNLMFRHELARYDIPNEQVQQAAGQRQDGEIYENIGLATYQHLFSSDVLANFGMMIRDKSTNLSSNPLSTPVIAFQANNFTEAYFKGSVSIHRGRNEWKLGADSENLFLHEHFADIITDPSQFDPGTPPTFAFSGSRPDLEQSAYVQDLIRLGNWTINAGVRWDHYQLILNQNAVSPRLAVSRYFPSHDLLVHVAYDRVFQTPSADNILLSSSPDVVVLNPNVLHIPVAPAQGNYYEAGITKAFLKKVSLDTNVYFRSLNNFADDDLLLNTPVSFPIAFRQGQIYGTEAKLNMPVWGRFSSFVSYSYMVGSAYFPVTGGLFLGQSATDALTDLSGRFWVSQDQRNTVRARVRYQFANRLWGAFGAEYSSGLPVDFDGTYEDALAQYGQDVLDRVNFERSRVRPALLFDASVGAELWKKDRTTGQLQFDVQNLTNQLDLINFAGLFSGNSIGPPRSFFVRIAAQF